MKLKTIGLILLLTSCGITLHHEVSGGANVGLNGTINVVQSIDFASLTKFFTDLCKQNLGVNATQQQINDCVTEQTNNFFNALSASSNSSNSNTGH